MGKGIRAIKSRNEVSVAAVANEIGIQKAAVIPSANAITALSAGSTFIEKSY